MSHPKAEHVARCPGCGHSCCPYPSLECGGDSDMVRECRIASLTRPRRTDACPASPIRGDKS